MMWLIFALLVIVAAIFIIFPLFKKENYEENASLESDRALKENILVFKSKKVELLLQLEAGIISHTEYLELLSEQKYILSMDTTKKSKLIEKKYINRGAWLILLSLMLMPVFAFSVYHILGASKDLDITNLLKKRASVFMSNEDRIDLNNIIQKKMSDRLLDDPEHPYYLVALAQLKMEDGNFIGARLLYSEALDARPNDSNLLSEFAQAIYFSEDKKFTKEVNSALDRALFLNSNNTTALGLQGIRYFESGQYRLAIKSWKNALTATTQGTAEANALNSSISYAKNLIQEDKYNLSIEVSISPEYKIKADKVVYIYAREWKGSPKPIAAVRLNVSELPKVVSLNDTVSIMGGKTLSSVDFLEIIARVSMSGSVTPMPGDYQGTTGKLRAETQNKIQIQINSKL